MSIALLIYIYAGVLMGWVIGDEIAKEGKKITAAIGFLLMVALWPLFLPFALHLAGKDED